MKSLAVLAVLGMAVAGATAAGAHSYRVGAIEIGHVWAPPSRDDATAVYGPLLNTGGAPDTLVAVSSPAAKSAALRDTRNGQIVTLGSIALPPGKPVTLAGWGKHVAIEGLAHPLRRGDSFDLTLRFARAGEITVKVMVQPSAAEF